MNPTFRILVIDDDPSIESVLTSLLATGGFELNFSRTAAAGLQRLQEKCPDVLVLDAILPDAQGLDLLAKVTRQFPRLPVLYLLAGGSVQSSIDAVKAGAFDCLRRPLQLGVLGLRIEEACHVARARRSVSSLLSIPNSGEASVLVGETPSMQTVFNAIGRAARYDGPVLIQGERGTGKETAAKTIHQHSARSESPFEIIHCPAYSSDRLELELFGTGNGSASGMDRYRGGTIVFQEIGELTLSMQTRLLQWLRAFGDGWAAKDATACRVIACSSDELMQHVRRGSFRADLYYHLAGELIHIPPLRERRSDIPLLVSHLLRILCDHGQISSRGLPHVSDDAMERMVAYDWPGNIDELYSVLRRCLLEGQGSIVISQTLLRATERFRMPASEVAVRHEDDTITTDWSAFLSTQLDQQSEDIYANAIAEAEARLLPMILEHTHGNQSQAARLLGITRASLRKRLKPLRSVTL
jgi:two-component system nitrogen regulation response regulator GlnG